MDSEPAEECPCDGFWEFQMQVQRNEELTQEKRKLAEKVDMLEEKVRDLQGKLAKAEETCKNLTDAKKKRERPPKHVRQERKKEYEMVKALLQEIFDAWSNRLNKRSNADASVSSVPVSATTEITDGLLALRTQIDELVVRSQTPRPLATVAVDDTSAGIGAISDPSSSSSGQSTNSLANIRVVLPCPHLLQAPLKENMFLISPLHVRFTHKRIQETFMPFLKDGVMKEDMSILASAEEIIRERKLPKDLELIDVVWHDGRLYVAGTFNRRLCMHRLLALFFPEMCPLIRVRIVDKNSPRVHFTEKFSTTCEGKWVQVGSDHYVGRTRAEVRWEEAIQCLSNLSPQTNAPNGGAQHSSCDIDVGDTATEIQEFAAKHDMFLPAVEEILAPLERNECSLVVRRFKCPTQDGAVNKLRAYVASCISNGFRLRDWADEYESIDAYLQTKQCATSQHIIGDNVAENHNETVTERPGEAAEKLRDSAAEAEHSCIEAQQNFNRMNACQNDPALF